MCLLFAQRLRDLLAVRRRRHRIEPPESISAGTSLVTGCVASGGLTALRPDVADREHLLGDAPSSAVPASVARVVGQHARHVLRAGHRVVQRGVHLLGDDRPVTICATANSGAQSPCAAALEHFRQQDRELGRVGERMQRGEHGRRT